MILKPLALFLTRLFTADFTKSIIFGLFGWKVLMKVKLLLLSVDNITDSKNFYLRKAF